MRVGLAHGWRVPAAWLVLALGASLLVAPAAEAAQIVVLDLKPAGGTSKNLASALNPVLVAELSKIDGMSVVSAADVRALLEHESNKAALGCDDTSCMTDIAGSLGAELLATPTVSVVGRDVIITLTLIQVDGAKVVRRSTGKVRGQENAPEAIASAVHDLFREGLPRELEGPASMSRRGFNAALQGLVKAVLKKNNDKEAQASRKRVVLDLVNTELDYDAKPKMVMFQTALRQGARMAASGHHGAKTAADAQHYAWAQDMFDAMWRDHGRVEEIRERARARGLVPSARPLRFEDPEPPTEMPDEAEFERYWRSAHSARKIAVNFTRAFNRRDIAGCLKWMTTSGRHKESTERSLQSAMDNEQKRKVARELMAKHNYTVKLRKRANDSLKKPDETIVFVARWQDGEVIEAKRLTLQKEGGKWRVRYF